MQQDQRFDFIIKILTDNNQNQLKNMIENGFDVNTISYGKNRCALIHAIDQNNMDMVSFLLKHGACPLKLDAESNSCLMRALSSEKPLEMIQLILEHVKETQQDKLPHLLAIKNKYSQTILVAAIHRYRLDVVDLLLNFKTDVNQDCKYKRPALWYCIEQYQSIRRKLHLQMMDSDGAVATDHYRHQFKLIVEIGEKLIQHRADYTFVESMRNQDMAQDMNSFLVAMQQDWMSEKQIIENIDNEALKKVFSRYLCESLSQREHIMILRSHILSLLKIMTEQPPLKYFFSIIASHAAHAPIVSIHQAIIDMISWEFIAIQTPGEKSFEAARFRYAIEYVQKIVHEQDSVPSLYKEHLIHILLNKIHKKLCDIAGKKKLWPAIPQRFTLYGLASQRIAIKFLFHKSSLFNHAVEHINALTLEMLEERTREPHWAVIWGALFCPQEIAAVEEFFRNNSQLFLKILGMKKAMLENPQLSWDELVSSQQDELGAIYQEYRDVELADIVRMMDMLRQDYVLAKNHAILHKNKQMLKYFLDNKNINQAFIDAAAQGDLDTITSILLILSEYDMEKRVGILNHQDSQGYTALMHAVINEHFDVINMLIEVGCHLELENANGQNILMLAVLKKNPFLLQYLLNIAAPIHPNLINCTDKSGYTPLYLAVEQHFEDGIVLLLKKGAHWIVHSAAGVYSPLMLACSLRSMPCLRTLLGALRERPVEEQSAVLNFKNHMGQSAVYLASRWHFYEIVDTLLSAGACLSHSIDSTGMTALSLACVKGYRSCVQIILKHLKRYTPEFQAQFINYQNKEGKTALYMAASMNQSLIVDMLLKEQASLTIATSQNRNTPLMVACCHGHTASVKVIFKHINRLSIEERRMILEQRTIEQQTAFSFVQHKNFPDIIRLFIELEQQFAQSADPAPKRRRLS